MSEFGVEPLPADTSLAVMVKAAVGVGGEIVGSGDAAVGLLRVALLAARPWLPSESLQKWRELRDSLARWNELASMRRAAALLEDAVEYLRALVAVVEGTRDMGALFARAHRFALATFGVGVLRRAVARRISELHAPEEGMPASGRRFEFEYDTATAAQADGQ